MFPTAIIAAAFAALALAAPAPAEPVAVEDANGSVNLTARWDPYWARLFTYTAENCPDKESIFNVDNYSQEGYGYQCIRTTSPSLSVTGFGCNTRTWNNADCTGISWTFPDSRCYTGSGYQSVSLECGRGA